MFEIFYVEIIISAEEKNRYLPQIHLNKFSEFYPHRINPSN